MRGVPSFVLATVSKEEQEEFKNIWMHSTRVLVALQGVVNKKLKESRKSKDDYSNAAWAYWAADRNGYDKAMREILELIS